MKTSSAIAVLDRVRLPADERTVVVEAMATLAQRRQGRALINAMERDQRAVLRQSTRELVEVLQDLGDRVADAFEAEATVLFEADTKQDRKVVNRIVEKADIGGWVASKLKPAVKNVRRRTMERLKKTIRAKTGLAVGIPDKVAERIMNTGGSNLGLKDLKPAVRRQVMKILQQARAEGVGPVEAARRIRELIPAGPWQNAGVEYRAKLIARTEILDSQRKSSLAAYKDAENVDAVQAFDGDGDPDCAARNGRIFSIEDAESEEEHPNGTLNWAPIVKGMTPPGRGRPN